MAPEIELASAGLEAGESSKRTPRPKTPPIFRAPANIRYDRKNDFEPKLVSIGPYYHGREELETMEKLKPQFIAYLLKKQIGESSEAQDLVPIHEFMQFIREAHLFYKEKFDQNGDDFVRMLFRDSCFIIRIILSFSQDLQENMTFLHVNIKEVRSDLLLLENQIPLFFIREVYNWLFFPRTDHPILPPFEIVLEPFICFDIPWRINHGAMSSGAYHLLELYWRCSSSPHINVQLDKFRLNPSEEEAKKEFEEELSHSQVFNEPYNKMDSSRNSWVYRTFVKKNKPSEQPSLAEFHRLINAPKVIVNATELHQMAGINFEKLLNDEGHANEGLDVIFSNGIIRMPCLKIDSSQTTLLVNLIAFENSMLPNLRTYSSYMKLMDALIDSEKDVELLQHCGVIYNTLSSHTLAATFFNDIGNFCLVGPNTELFPFFYENVKKYYDSSRNRRLTSLRHNYFNSPWAVISVLAGVTLLILSALQTFYTIYQYYNPNEPTTPPTPPPPPTTTNTTF